MRDRGWEGESILSWPDASCHGPMHLVMALVRRCSCRISFLWFLLYELVLGANGFVAKKRSPWQYARLTKNRMFQEKTMFKHKHMFRLKRKVPGKNKAGLT